jgi:hypothetical protein
VKTALIPLLALLTACAGQQSNPNPFAAQADFAAQRELETLVVEDMSRDVACAHVTEVLMDLECHIIEVNSELGVISADRSFRWVHSGDFLGSRRIWQACGGSNVTVSVRERDDDIAIRATFEPPKPEANQAFRTLLRRSINEQAE